MDLGQCGAGNRLSGRNTIGVEPTNEAARRVYDAVGGAYAEAGTHHPRVASELARVCRPGGRIGLAVDALLGQEEAVLKPLEGHLHPVTGAQALHADGFNAPVDAQPLRS